MEPGTNTKVKAMAHILLIDDDEDTRAVLEELLSSAGHEVVTAADGKEGLAQFRAAPADLVITDLFMPNQEGLETISHLRRDFPDALIIAMSGNTVAGMMLSIAKRLGAVEVLQKPFFPRELMSMVEKVLQSRSQILTTTA